MRRQPKPRDPEHDREANRIGQQAYRDRHGDNLRLARRVATALMSLRGRRKWTWVGEDGRLGLVVQALAAFLNPDEVKQLAKLLRKQTAQK
jgi:hypothetical protein